MAAARIPAAKPGKLLLPGSRWPAPFKEIRSVAVKFPVTVKEMVVTRVLKIVLVAGMYLVT